MIQKKNIKGIKTLERLLVIIFCHLDKKKKTIQNGEKAKTNERRKKDQTKQGNKVRKVKLPVPDKIGENVRKVKRPDKKGNKSKNSRQKRKKDKKRHPGGGGLMVMSNHPISQR